MTEENENIPTQQDLDLELDDGPSKKDILLEGLKKKADLMGIKYHHRIGVEKLTNLIKEHEAAAEKPAEPRPQTAPGAAPAIAKKEEALPKGVRKLTRMEHLRREASRQVRIRVTCMNPAKKEWEGEIYTVSNSVVGTFKKFVPFNNEDGWHVPNIIYKHMKERQCQIFYNVKGPRGNKIRKGKLIRELNIEVLPPLTAQERSELARKQAMARNSDNR
jgi:hypothetical protein